MPFDGGVRDAHRDAVARIAEYDRQRSTALLKTLEEFLRRRGSIGATAEALYVHPNTLRQRLRGIGELLRHRPAQGRLAHGRDRREDGPPPRGARPERAARALTR